MYNQFRVTKKINRQNKNRAESGSGYSQTNKPKPGSEPTLFKKVKPNTSKIPVTPSEVVGSTPFDAKSGTKRKVDVTKNLTRKNRGFKEPLKIKKTRNVKTPKVELPPFVKNKTVNNLADDNQFDVIQLHLDDKYKVMAVAGLIYFEDRVNGKKNCPKGIGQKSPITGNDS